MHLGAFLALAISASSLSAAFRFPLHVVANGRIAGSRNKNIYWRARPSSLFWKNLLRRQASVSHSSHESHIAIDLKEDLNHESHFPVDLKEDLKHESHFPLDLKKDLERQYLISPREAAGAAAWIEIHPDLPLPRMCIVANDPPMSNETITMFLEFLEDALELDRPFSVLWDVSKPGCAFPSRKHFRRVITWLEADGKANAKAYDKAVQGHALVVTNSMIRAGIRFMASIAKPPQPVSVVKDQEKAFAFARDELLEAREYA